MNLKNLFVKSVNELKEAGIDTAELDVRILLEKALNKDYAFILSHPENFPTDREYQKFRKIIRRRISLEPIAYITGHKEFFGYDFKVNRNILIPRPETEFLVEKGLEYINKIFKTNIKDPLIIADIGAGSGAIIISIAKELNKDYDLSNFRFIASDISKKALGVARRNAKKHCVDKNIKFYLSDLFDNKSMPKKYDLVLANLPYVPIGSKSKKKQPIDFEPQNAIFAKKNGSQIIELFLKQIKTKLNENSTIIIELDPRNYNEIARLAKSFFGDNKVLSFKDLRDKNRYIICRSA